MIETPRLLLFPATPHALTAALQGRDALALALEMRVPSSWPPAFYDDDAIKHTLAALTQSPDDHDWHAYFFARQPGDDGRAMLVGAGGFKGAPRDDGIVEIGYSIVDDAHRRGYATEAVRGLVGRAFVDARVDRVIAHTLPTLAPSIGVLGKCGFRHVGEGDEPGTICYALRRDEFVTD